MGTIGFNTRSIGEHRSAREAVDFAAESGIRGVELDGRWLWQDVLSPADVNHIRVQGAANGIHYSIHFAHSAVPASHDLEARARHLADLGQTIRFARDIRAGLIVVHIGRIEVLGIDPAQAPEAVRREALENGVEFLRAAARLAEDTGVVLGVENLLHKPGDVLQSYQELVEVVEASGSQVVGITLDTGHAELTDGLDDAVEAFGPHLRHLHVHDCVGGEDHHEVGQGSLDLSKYADVLRKVPFTMALEVGTSAVLALESGEEPKEMVLRSIAAVKTMLGDLAE